MDDYMINEDSSSSSESQSEASGSSSNSFASFLGEELEPEVRIQKQMENYYDRNYSCFKVGQIDNFCKERVWNVYYD